MCAKDIAAAAVLICASVAVLAGLFLFGDFETIKKIAVYFFYNPAALVLLAVSFVLDFFFIRSFKQAQKGD
ncbi:MAG: hypothetical protein LBC56_07280, partial [Oscillospiraceae bacterium]|jgi:predicted membrane channel-forming protein YqfA (hemolysin III family)|nr:hypothetical protein [Oscillospiraceae bacterium]